MAAAKFISQNPENGDYNQVRSLYKMRCFDPYFSSDLFLQYWYSNYTINQMAEDCVNVGGRIAFLSTPSIYFALPDEAREKSFCFDVSLVDKC